jgi:hypothetical protein
MAGVCWSRSTSGSRNDPRQRVAIQNRTSGFATENFPFQISLQNRASCRGLQTNGRGRAAPPLSRQALACSSRRHILVPERFCKPLFSRWRRLQCVDVSQENYDAAAQRTSVDCVRQCVGGTRRVRGSATGRRWWVSVIPPGWRHSPAGRRATWGSRPGHRTMPDAAGNSRESHALDDHAANRAACRHRSARGCCVGAGGNDRISRPGCAARWR